MGAAARRADPPGVLDGHEPVQSHLTDPVQVLQHAHAVPGPIAQVQLSQSAAGVLGTVEAEGSPCGPLGAQLDTADLTVILFSSLHGQAPCAPVLLPQVGGTDSAVHPAGRHHQGGDAGRALSDCRHLPPGASKSTSTVDCSRTTPSLLRDAFHSLITSRALTL